MAFAAGQNITAEALNHREATTVATSDSGTFTTTETVVDSVTAALINGRIYRVRWYGGVASTTTDSVVLVRIRENNVSGTIINERNFAIPTTTTPGVGTPIEAEFPADATGNKTFVITCVRNGGTGTLHGDGAATRSRYLYVDDVR